MPDLRRGSGRARAGVRVNPGCVLNPTIVTRRDLGINELARRDGPTAETWRLAANLNCRVVRCPCGYRSRSSQALSIVSRDATSARR